MLADDLKEQTLAPHQQLEKILVGKIKTIAAETDYIDLLKLFYSYFGGLETLIGQHIGPAQLTDYNERRKTAALANDLQSLDASSPQKAQAGNLPVIDNTAKAFGALYVIEGSTLGGSIISKMIAGRLGIQKGLSFFNGYGEKSQEMWSSFRAALNQLPPDRHAEVIDAASDTFSGFERWIVLHDTGAIALK